MILSKKNKMLYIKTLYKNSIRIVVIEKYKLENRKLKLEAILWKFRTLKIPSNANSHVF